MIQEETEWRANHYRDILIGHLIIGFILGTCTAVFAYASLRVLGYTVSIRQLFLIANICVITTEPLLALLYRERSKAEQLISPGGWLIPIVRVIICSLAYPVVTLIITGEKHTTVILLSAFLVVEAISIVILKPYEKGMTREEVDKAWQKTKELTKGSTEDND